MGTEKLQQEILELEKIIARREEIQVYNFSHEIACMLNVQKRDLRALKQQLAERG